MESKVINHFCHEHPLILKENASEKEGTNCYACGTPVAYLEMAYVCVQQNCSNNSIIFHNKCGDLPLEIFHPKHPEDHPLKLFDFRNSINSWCDLCGRDLARLLGYKCSLCPFKVDTKCVDCLLEGKQVLHHPSHPDHPLTLMRKPAFAFRCDGCGDQDVDMAYICSTCEFWVHKRCALLPTTRRYHRRHHPLFLIFSLPEEHCYYNYRCNVCDNFFDRTCWLYFCGVCRYFAHFKCVGPHSHLIEDDDDGDNDGLSDVIQFPLEANDASNKLIIPFVMREKGLDNIPTPTSNLFLSNYHDHPLSLVTQEADNDEEEEEEEELIKICDVCVTSISLSSPYYQCPTSSCKFFIHSICSMLPKTLQFSSSPGLLQLYGNCQEIPNKNHNFTLYIPKGRDATMHWYCNICYDRTNGMGYKCEECETKIDVKCASLPTAIIHSSHSLHPLILTRIPPQQAFGLKKSCRYCQFEYSLNSFVYCCSYCDFALHSDCALMPRSITVPEVDDKHPLLLTFDPSINHPSEFYCEFCEEEMHPKNWMYHCRECDISLHRGCLEGKSGVYGNIKLGRRFELGDIHPHPLTFTYVTLKQFCDVCHQEVYTDLGFECVSCYYVVCRYCGYQELEKII